MISKLIQTLSSSLLIASLLTLASPTAQARQDGFYYDFCPTEFTVSANPITWRANRNNLQTIPITVRFSERTDSCVTHILFYTDNDPNLVLRSGTESIATDLVDRSRSHFAQYSINGRQAYVVPVNNTKRLKVWAQLQSTEAVIAGEYSGAISVVATYYGYHISPEVLGTIELDVPSVLDVSVPTSGNSTIFGSGSYYYVELGNLHEGKSANWNIDIYSNVHYQVSVQSENLGLKHQNSSDRIHYDVIMDGARFSSSSGYARAYTNYNPLSTNTVSFEVEVGSTDLKPAGRYTDNLIVTVSAR